MAEHRISLVFANGKKRCLNGDLAIGGDVVVTCDCHLKYEGAHGKYIALAPELSDAWSWWNNPDMHVERETFVPNEKMARLHGVAVQ